MRLKLSSAPLKLSWVLRVIVLFSLVNIAGISGYVSSNFYKKLSGDNWVWNIVLTSCLFAGKVIWWGFMTIDMVKQVGIVVGITVYFMHCFKKLSGDNWVWNIAFTLCLFVGKAIWWALWQLTW